MKDRILENTKTLTRKSYKNTSTGKICLVYKCLNIIHDKLHKVTFRVNSTNLQLIYHYYIMNRPIYHDSQINTTKTTLKAPLFLIQILYSNRNQFSCWHKDWHMVNATKWSAQKPTTNHIQIQLILIKETKQILAVS